MERAEQIVAIAYDALDEKKAVDITVMDIHEISPIADYFIITNGENVNQVQALVDNVQEKLGRAGFECKSVEGSRGSSWILLDYVDVVIHIFSSDDRRFFNLERIWRDGKVLENIPQLDQE